MTIKNLIVILGLIVIASTLYGLLRLAYFVRISGDVVGQSGVYQQEPASPSKKILVLGDSTAVGTGAVDPANSVAGRLGKDFPKAKIVNKAQNGSRSLELLEDLDSLIDDQYDLIVIHIGANDVLRLKNLDQTKKNIRQIINRAQAKSTYTALFTSGNIGQASLIPWFARPLMSSRSKELRDFGVNLDKELNNFVYVDLYYKNPDISDNKFYARDKLHLSDEGYGFWYRELKSALEEKSGLYGG